MAGQGDSQQDITAIHQFWFGPLDDAGFATQEKQKLWFSADPQTDTAIASRFGDLVTRGLAGELESWAGSDGGPGRPGAAAGPVSPQYLPRHRPRLRR